MAHEEYDFDELDENENSNGIDFDDEYEDIDIMQEDESDDYLMHYGTPRHSGRYPWGSGKEPYQHSGDFLSRVESLRKSNPTYIDEETGTKYSGDTAVAKIMGMSSTAFRAQVGLAKAERARDEIDSIKSMKGDGLSNSEIGRRLGKPESSIRTLLKADEEGKIQAKIDASRGIADYIEKQIDAKGMVDVGKGVERELGNGISKEKLEQALEIIKMDGYEVYGGGLPQVTNKGKQTILKVACPPGTQHKEIFNPDNIHSLQDYVSYDQGETFKPAFQFPSSLDSKRLQIRYAEEGGIEKDGVIEVRRGCKDLSLGESQYAQVRILVDGDRYLKGMAVYSDNLPDGVDVMFNTNKAEGTPMRDVLKKVKRDAEGNIDQQNPFGSLIKERGGQSMFIDSDGKEKLSLINKRAEEGDWGKWSKTLASQFLSKQNKDLIDKQLNLTAADKQLQFDEIMSLTNPAVKKQRLMAFADDCDSAAVHLKAAGFPGQKYQVIIPITSLKDNQAYAPNFKEGSQLALVRFPHGGTFEIPIVTVTNKNPEGINVLGKTPADAIGINSKVAERLSGADFDGDTVLAIPITSRTKITSTKALEGLKDFDPKAQYPYREGMTLMKDEARKVNNTQKEMGMISNLITDMTLKGATPDELARAVRHSMVVIDAGKHKLDYKQSEKDNGIAALKKQYQGHFDENGRYREGASTLISRAKGETTVDKRVGQKKIDPETGEYIYKYDDKPYYTTKVNKRTGEVTTIEKFRTQQSTQMFEAKDARKLSSGTVQEELYANYANKMKALGNEARKQSLMVQPMKQNPQAKITYSKEISSLEAKYNEALKNKPRERQAQLLANSMVKAKMETYPDMTKDEKKKVSQQSLAYARQKVGARRTPMVLNDREWEAIQKGALSHSKLTEMIKYFDQDDLVKRSTPRQSKGLSASQEGKIKAMKASGYTTAQIAEAIGVSSSTVSKYIHG